MTPEEFYVYVLGFFVDCVCFGDEVHPNPSGIEVPSNVYLVDVDGTDFTVSKRGDPAQLEALVDGVQNVSGEWKQAVVAPVHIQSECASNPLRDPMIVLSKFPVDQFITLALEMSGATALGDVLGQMVADSTKASSNAFDYFRRDFILFVVELEARIAVSEHRSLSAVMVHHFYKLVADLGGYEAAQMAKKQVFVGASAAHVKGMLKSLFSGLDSGVGGFENRLKRVIKV